MSMEKERRNLSSSTFMEEDDISDTFHDAKSYQPHQSISETNTISSLSSSSYESVFEVIPDDLPEIPNTGRNKNLHYPTSDEIVLDREPTTEDKRLVHSFHSDWLNTNTDRTGKSECSIYTSNRWHRSNSRYDNNRSVHTKKKRQPLWTDGLDDENLHLDCFDDSEEDIDCDNIYSQSPKRAKTESYIGSFGQISVDPRRSAQNILEDPSLAANPEQVNNALFHPGEESNPESSDTTLTLKTVPDIVITPCETEETSCEKNDKSKEFRAWSIQNYLKIIPSITVTRSSSNEDELSDLSTLCESSVPSHTSSSEEEIPLYESDSLEKELEKAKRSFGGNTRPSIKIEIEEALRSEHEPVNFQGSAACKSDENNALLKGILKPSQPLNQQGDFLDGFKHLGPACASGDFSKLSEVEKTWIFLTLGKLQCKRIHWISLVTTGNKFSRDALKLEINPVECVNKTFFHTPTGLAYTVFSRAEVAATIETALASASPEDMQRLGWNELKHPKTFKRDALCWRDSFGRLQFVRLALTKRRNKKRMTGAYLFLCPDIPEDAHSIKLRLTDMYEDVQFFQPITFYQDSPAGSHRLHLALVNQNLRYLRDYAWSYNTNDHGKPCELYDDHSRIHNEAMRCCNASVEEHKQDQATRDPNNEGQGAVVKEHTQVGFVLRFIRERPVRATTVMSSREPRSPSEIRHVSWLTNNGEIQAAESSSSSGAESVTCSESDDASTDVHNKDFSGDLQTIDNYLDVIQAELDDIDRDMENKTAEQNENETVKDAEKMERWLAHIDYVAIGVGAILLFYLGRKLLKSRFI